MSPPPAIMFQGTGSDVGKSLLVAGLCRAYTNRGLTVRPFKPQNMSNNAAVTVDGGEIGRAQALQARAAKIEPSVHMNPVLLKPETETGAQVVVQGQMETTAMARDYFALKPKLMPRVLESFEITGKGADLVLVEGAGSAAEINLRKGDIANMGFAMAAHVPVVLIGDIDRGGVIASLVGTYGLLPEEESTQIAGFMINKFRGDTSLFDSAIDLITEKTGFRSFGVVPYFANARFLPKEDAMALDNQTDNREESPCGSDRRVTVAVPRIPRIANFDDLDPLMAEPGITVRIVEAGEVIPADTDVILIPGSKATLADFSFLCEQRWDIDIKAHHRRGGMVIGLCGGYQMLGTDIHDPEGIEGPPGRRPGLGLLDVQTTMMSKKILVETDGVEIASKAPVRGYEIHIGKTTGPDCGRPWFQIRGAEPEGAISADSLVMGSYLHGIFGEDVFRAAFFDRIRSGFQGAVAFEERIEQVLDELAVHLETHADLDGLFTAAGGAGSAPVRRSIPR